MKAFANKYKIVYECRPSRPSCAFNKKGFFKRTVYWKADSREPLLAKLRKRYENSAFVLKIVSVELVESTTKVVLD